MNENETYPIRRIAKVVEDDDSSRPNDSKKGAIQVLIAPELSELNSSDLPWATPKDSSGTGFGSNADIGQHWVPMKDTYVYVEIQDPAWQYIYYLPFGPHLYSNYIYDTAKDLIDIEDYTPPEYPEPQMKSLPDGSVIFYDRDRGDMGLQHPSGLYVFFSKEGDIKVKYMRTFTLQMDSGSDLKLEIDDTGKIILTTEKLTILSSQIELGEDNPSSEAALFVPLETILTDLLNHIHVSPGPGPTTPAMDSSQAPLSSKTGDLQQIKSETTKIK